VESSWVLQAIREENPSRDDSRLAEMRLWLLLDSELKDVSNQIVLAERRVPEQRLEIERLTQVLGEGQKFRSKANEKFTLAQQELKQAQAALLAKREEVAGLEAAYDLAQRVTPMGRLVSLSRESLEREWRWVDSAIKSQGPVQTEEFLAAIEKGEKILVLKREIALEEIKIRALGGDVGTEGAVVQEPEEGVQE